MLFIRRCDHGRRVSQSVASPWQDRAPPEHRSRVEQRLAFFFFFFIFCPRLLNSDFFSDNIMLKVTWARESASPSSMMAWRRIIRTSRYIFVSFYYFSIFLTLIFALFMKPNFRLDSSYNFNARIKSPNPRFRRGPSGVRTLSLDMHELYFVTILL